MRTELLGADNGSLESNRLLDRTSRDFEGKNKADCISREVSICQKNDLTLAVWDRHSAAEEALSKKCDGQNNFSAFFNFSLDHSLGGQKHNLNSVLASIWVGTMPYSSRNGTFNPKMASCEYSVLPSSYGCASWADPIYSFPNWKLFSDPFWVLPLSDTQGCIR